MLVKCKVLVTSQTHVSNEFAQHLFHRPSKKLQNLWSVSFLMHVDNLQITAVYGSLKAPQHVSVDLVCIEFWIFQDTFDQIHDCCGCEEMLIGICFHNVIRKSSYYYTLLNY